MRSVREHLDRSGIPSAGPDHRRLADSMTGRLLATLLDLADAVSTQPESNQYDRDTVMGLVEAAPVRGPDGKRIRSGPWESISRSAGIVGGLTDWHDRLDAHMRSLHERAKRQSESGASSGYLNSIEREGGATESLQGFVAWLGELTSPVAVGRSWAERSRWARETLVALLPSESLRSDWPESESQAADRIDVLLTRLAVLDEIEPDLTAATFRRAIQLELDSPAGRRGAFGSGVFVAPLASAVGIDLDEIFIVGLAEGVCPRPIREDTLLPDVERQHTNGGLPQRLDRNRQERERYLHAVAGGARVTVTSPLGDHRSGRPRTASRWWVEAVRHLADDPTITSETWTTHVRFGRLDHGSFTSSLTNAVHERAIVSAADLQLHYVHAAHALNTPVTPANIAPTLRRGLDLTAHRLDGFNRFTGNLRDASVRSPLADSAAISPSRLESWASCPRKFFFEQMLGLGEIERPEEILEISPLDRGSLVHQILEDFIAESLPSAEHALDGPDQRWSEDDRVRLHTHAAKRSDEYEKLGRTGRPLLWKIHQEATAADFDAFLPADEKFRTDKQMVPHEVELPFGIAPRPGQATDGARAEAAMIRTAQGREIPLRGLIDRVDWRAGDGVPVVIDYKTGKATPQSELEKDPVRGGKSLQLGAYAEAVKQHYGVDNAQAYYWYISAKGQGKRAGYTWSDPNHERFLDAVDTIVSGIEAGDFPPNPGDYSTWGGDFENCRYCPFTRICPVDRDEELERAITSGSLVDFVALGEFDAQAEAAEAEAQDGGPS